MDKETNHIKKIQGIYIIPKLLHFVPFGEVFYSQELNLIKK